LKCPHDCPYNHITLDWDDVKPGERDAPYSYDGVIAIKCEHWRLSPSGDGLHVLICHRGEPGAVDIFSYRMKWGDDAMRVSFDIIRYEISKGRPPVEADADWSYVEGRIWDMKNDRRAGPWHDF